MIQESAVYIEDLSLTTDDEHVNVLGKGSQRRTVLLDDQRLVAMLRNYLKQTGYKYGRMALRKAETLAV